MDSKLSALQTASLAADGSAMRSRKRGCLPWRRWSRKVSSPTPAQLESVRPLRGSSPATKLGDPQGEVAVIRVQDACLADFGQPPR